MTKGKQMSDRGSLHVKRRSKRLSQSERFDGLYFDALGRCVRAARRARRAALVATLLAAAIGCGYSELEMQAQRDKAAQLEAAVYSLADELKATQAKAAAEQCK